MTTTQKVAGVMTSALVVLTSRGAKGETTVASNWTTQSKDSLVTVQTNGSTVTVTLPDQFAIMSSAVVEPHPSTGGSYTGNYARAGASSLGLTVGGNSTLPYGAHIRLTATTEHLWVRYGLANGTNVIALHRVNGGWMFAGDGYDEGTLDAFWAEDMQKVSGLAVRLIRNPSAVGSQTVVLSNFRLESTRAVGAASLSLEDALFAEFGETNTADLSDVQILEDDDADGMTDLDEILAALSPCDQAGDFATGIFEASVTNVTPGSAEITFACVAGESYTIYRSSTVGGSETVVGSKYPMHTGFDSVFDTNAVGAAAFYTIRQNCP